MRHITETTTTGTLDGFVTATVKPEDMAHMMQVASTQYARKEDAVLRELATNGLDAQYQAGIHSPIHVTIPSLDHPKVIISDQGIGMSPETMTEVYGNYYSSTKRDLEDDQQITVHGLFGIGSKTPYAVATQFFVVSVHEGIKSTMLFIKETGGLPASKIISQEPTDEPNGVSVEVPISYDNLELWTEAAQRVFFWWEEHTVVVTQDGHDITPASYSNSVQTICSSEHISSLGIYRDDKLIPDVVRRQLRNGPTLLMGSIGYEIPTAALPRTISSWEEPIVIHADLNDGLSYPPSRETIEDTPTLRELLDNHVENWIDTSKVQIAELLKEAKTSLDVYRIARDIPWNMSRLTGHRMHETLVKQLNLPPYLGQRPKGSFNHDTDIEFTKATQVLIFHKDDPVKQGTSLYYTLKQRGATSHNPSTSLYYTQALHRTILRRDLSDANFRLLQRWRRHFDYPALIVIPQDTVLEPFMTEHDANWLEWEQIVAETPKPQPKRKDSNPTMRVYPQYPASTGRYRNPADEIRLNDITAKLTDKHVIVAGTLENYEDTADEHSRILRALHVVQREFNAPEFGSTVFIARGNRSLKTLSALFDHTVYTPQQYSKLVLDHVVNALTPKQRQHFAEERAINRPRAVHPTLRQMQDYSTASRKFLQHLEDIQETISYFTNTAQPIKNHPAIPESKLKRNYPLTIKLLNHSAYYQMIDPDLMNPIVELDIANRSIQKATT